MKIPRSWLKMEADHSSSEKVQRRIVMQHVAEFGRGYYPALKQMELKLNRRK